MPREDDPIDDIREYDQYWLWAPTGGKPGGAPNPPANVAAAVTAATPQSITLTLNVLPGGQTFNVYRGTTPGGESATPIATAQTGTSYVDSSGLSDDTTYYYYLKAVSGSQSSTASSEVSATTLPAAPASVVATVGVGSLSISFTNLPAGQTLNVYRGTSSGTETSYATGQSGTSPYVDSSVTPGTTYYYKLTAVHGALESVQSSEVSAAPWTPTTPGSALFGIDFSLLASLFQDSTLTTPVAADGDKIGGAVDQSGNAVNFLQATAGNRPTYKAAIQNGKSIARSAGGGGIGLGPASFTNTLTAASLVLVAKTNNVTSSYEPLTIVGANFAYIMVDNGSGHWLGRVFPSGTTRTIDSGSGSTAWNLWILTWTGSVATLYLNGGSVGTPGTATGNLAVAATNTGLIHAPADGVGFNGDVGEAWCYSKALTAGDIANWLAYAQAKWGTP